MVKIASHCVARPYTPQCEWPETTYVQWGGGGLVVKNDGSGYRTAFFEACPDDNSSGFIRGEGESIEAAERSAFARWEREINCQHTHWQRREYRNGLGFCAKCGAAKSVFQPIHTLGYWRKPIQKHEEWLLEDIDFDDPIISRYQRKLLLRRKLFGVDAPGKAGGVLGMMERILEKENGTHPA